MCERNKWQKEKAKKGGQWYRYKKRINRQMRE